MSKSVLLKIWISVTSSGYKLCYGGLSNTPKPLRIVKGSWRIVKPEVDSRLSGVVILEVWETISYDMKTHTRSQFARDLKNIPHGGWKCCRIDTNRFESNDSTQQMTTRHTGCRFARHLENIVFFCKLTSGMTDRHLLWRVVRFESNRVESSTFATLYSDDRLPVVSRFKNVEGSCWHVLVSCHSFLHIAHVRAPRLPVC